MSDNKNDINMIPTPKLKPDLKSLLTKSNSHVMDAMDVIKSTFMAEGGKANDKFQAAKTWVMLNIQLNDEIQKSELRRLQIQSIALNNKKRTIDLDESSDNYKRSDDSPTDTPTLDVTGGFGFVDGNKPLRN